MSLTYLHRGSIAPKSVYASSIALEVQLLMQISETFSHANGLEYLLVHRPQLWTELQNVITEINAGACRIEVANHPSVSGAGRYSSKQLRKQFRKLLEKLGWKESWIDFYITRSEKRARALLPMTSEDQRDRIMTAGESPISGRNQIDFVKDRVGLEVQFGRHELVTYDLYVRHFGLYVTDQIDVGIEILPMKFLQSQMSSRVPYFEGELYNVIRQERGVPAVPLVIVGIDP